MGIMKRSYDYDDPYKVLAHSIVGFYRPTDVIRILQDDDFILNCIVKEVRGHDMGGFFVDCVIDSLLRSGKRMSYMTELDKLAKYYNSELDKGRLRAEISVLLQDIGVC